jgi:hypothetical protein
VKLRALALGFDGAIAPDGRLGGDVTDAIREARRAGVMTVLVSGRMLADLQALLSAPDLFDAVVAEGGAVVQMANDARPIVLARGGEAVPAAFRRRDSRSLPRRPPSCVLRTLFGSMPSVTPRMFPGVCFDGALRTGERDLDLRDRSRQPVDTLVDPTDASGSRRLFTFRHQPAKPWRAST